VGTQAELEPLHGGPMVGARIGVDTGGAHWTLLRQRCSVHAPARLGWGLVPGPAVGPAESGAIGAFVGLG
jgi:hypothetical protein